MRHFFWSSVGRPSLWITERKEIPPSPFSFFFSQTSRKNSRDSVLPNGSASFWPEIRDFGGIHSLPGAKFVSQSRVFSVNSVNDFSFPELILVSCVLARSWRVVVRGGCKRSAGVSGVPSRRSKHNKIVRNFGPRSCLLWDLFLSRSSVGWC